MKLNKTGQNGNKQKVLGFFKGLQAQLFMLFFALSLIIILASSLVQILTLRNQIRKQTVSQIQKTANLISSSYGSDGYENTIRSTINLGDYLVRTINEDGDILIDTNELSVYRRWPDVSYDLETVIDHLENDISYYYRVNRKEDNTEWLIYTQVLAQWNDKKELLVLAHNTLPEKHQLRDQLLLLVQIAIPVIVIAFILSYFLSRRFLKPIREITQSSEQLSKGDYSVVFQKGYSTELDTLSDTLNQAVEQFASYDQMRREMISNVSHDMRTPLTIIKAYAEMIKTIPQDDINKTNQQLDVIISQTDKLSDFVEDTLYLGNLQAKNITLNYQKYALDEQVGRFARKLMQTDEGSHKFILDLDPGSMVNADPMQIERILTNLVTNALKYGDGTVELRVKKTSKGVRLEINDFGEGIPEDKLHHVWTRYFRVNPGDAGSSGVGLSIVKEIADIHKLDYGVSSPEGDGAKFWFVFPNAE